LASNEVLLDVTTAGNATSKELLAIVMGTVGSGKTLVLKGAEGAVLMGDGTVRFDGLTPVRLSGDAGSQNITGGSGRDTIIGGGGNDTVTGGSGADVFGFNKLTGNLTITDFQVGIDHLGFGIAGVTSASGLASQFTGLTQLSNGVKLSFGNEASITLIGVTAEQLTLDMLQYTL
jgi:Ca2+-binding RTX toxin-like protein